MKLAGRDRKIYRTTVASHLTTAAAALLVAGALLLAFEFVTLRREFVADLQAQTRIVALNSAAAVVFGDVPAAGETLSALSALSNLESAATFNADGRLLAEYRQEGAAPLAPPDEPLLAAGYAFDIRSLLTAERVMVAGQRVGTVVMRSSLDRLYGRLLSFAGVFLIVGLGALAVSYPLMSRMRGQVKSAEARLDHLAHYDPVTGLLNRNAFNEYLQTVARGPMPSDRQLGLLLLDVDNFKAVNDTLGHQVGDELLRQIAGRLTTAVRDGDRVFRVGGDEFAVTLFPIADVAQASDVARRLFAQFNLRFLLDGHEVETAVSGGISLYPQDAHSMQALASNADTAMYHAKRNGKNRFETFNAEMNRVIQHRLRLRNDLRRALDRGQFRLDYQVQAACSDLRITGIEALLRWDHPDLGLVPPSEFIPVAEESGLILPLGRWVILAACRQACEWRRAGLDDFRIAVNVSARQMRDDHLLAYIDEVLAETQLKPGDLELEITESLLFENAESSIAMLGKLRARGIHLAIDDFGTGYSSMAYLQQLPIDRLKIDRSFVDNIPGEGEVITTAIIAMAHRLGVSVVAEGVENETQLRFLRNAGCDAVQGYLLSRPLGAAQAAGLLRGSCLEERAGMSAVGGSPLRVRAPI